MLHKGALIVDYGPEFLGHVFQVDEGIVCVVPSQLDARIEAQAAMREMVGDLGGECGRCRNCPLGSSG